MQRATVGVRCILEESLGNWLLGSPWELLCNPVAWVGIWQVGAQQNAAVKPGALTEVSFKLNKLKKHK